MAALPLIQNIKEIKIIETPNAPDTLLVTLAPQFNPFPNLSSKAQIVIKTQQGYGYYWITELAGINPDLVVIQKS